MTPRLANVAVKADRFSKNKSLYTINRNVDEVDTVDGDEKTCGGGRAERAGVREGERELAKKEVGKEKKNTPRNEKRTRKRRMIDNQEVGRSWRRRSWRSRKRIRGLTTINPTSATLMLFFPLTFI